MATKIIMPKQGLLMEEGLIVEWLVSEGDDVEAGQPLFTIETDKATMEIESPESGNIIRILAEAGDAVPVGETIGFIGARGEDISALLEKIEKPEKPAVEETSDIPQEKELNKTKHTGSRVFITPRAKLKAKERGINYNDISGSGPDGLIVEKDILEYASQTLESGKVKTTPTAKKMAQIHGIDLAEVKGTGIHGKIQKTDIEARIEQSQSSTSSINGKLIPLSSMRKTVAERMMTSLHNMAQANHKITVDMTEIIALRNKLKESDRKVSYNDILIKIASFALRENPIINATLTDEGILLLNEINIGLAVAVENGLVVPVLKGVDELTLEQINEKSRELVDKARTGKLTLDEMTGGTFTVTNLGMYDIDSFTAIINPPESAILAVGMIKRVPVVVENDNITVRSIMELSLTYDHRVIDGAPAAKFLQDIKKYIENPYLLLY